MEHSSLPSVCPQIVSSGDTADWIQMPFVVVSGVEILVVIVEGEGAV